MRKQKHKLNLGMGGGGEGGGILQDSEQRKFEQQRKPKAHNLSFLKILCGSSFVVIMQYQ